MHISDTPNTPPDISFDASFTPPSIELAGSPHRRRSRRSLADSLQTLAPTSSSSSLPHQLDSTHNPQSSGASPLSRSPTVSISCGGSRGAPCLPRSSAVSISGGGGVSGAIVSVSTRPPSPPAFVPSLQDDSRNFIADFTSSTLLIDVPIDKLGTLVGLQSSITFVPDNLKELWSRCMTKYLEMVRSDTTNPMVWKKFFLVTTVVCSNNSPLMRKQLISNPLT